MIDILTGMGSLVCRRERELALELWNLLYEDKLTDLARAYFDDQTAEVFFNSNSGYVFLSDEDYNTVMINGGELDLFISTPYKGVEGFFDEVIEEYGDMHKEDKEYIRSIATEEQKKKYPFLLEEEEENKEQV